MADFIGPQQRHHGNTNTFIGGCVEDTWLTLMLILVQCHFLTEQMKKDGLFSQRCDFCASG